VPNKKWTNAPYTDEELLEVLGMLASLQDIGDPRVTWPTGQRVVRGQEPGGERWANRYTYGALGPPFDWEHTREMDEQRMNPTFERPRRFRPDWPTELNAMVPSAPGASRVPWDQYAKRESSPAVKEMRRQRAEAQLDRLRRMREIQRGR
jgi:hypothetical protein